jgi:hypothetical protein
MKGSNRFVIACQMLKYKNENILDLGCRDKGLKEHIPLGCIYHGVDYEDGVEVTGFNLENGIPFPDDSFDAVVALDVLEHVDNISFLAEEMKRVAKNEIIIAMPNVYHWHFILRMLSGRSLSAKYALEPYKVMDRHRWVTYHKSNVNFIHNIFSGMKIRALSVFPNYRRFKFLYWFDRLLSEIIPNNFIYTDFFHIDLKSK